MDSKFEWIEFYSELANKIIPYRNDRKTLIEKIKTVFSKSALQLPTLEKDGNVQDIDPFTIFGLFNKGITNENRIKILSAFAEELSVAAPVPTDFNGIPVLNNMKATFYYFEDERGDHDIDTLWDVFVSGVEYADHQNAENKEKLIKNYNSALKQKGIKWNITMGLFWIRPFTFINLDAKNREFMKSPELTSDELVAVLPKLTHVPKCEVYLELCDNYARLIAAGDYPYKNYPQLSAQAWLVSKDTGENENSDDQESSDDSAPEIPVKRTSKSGKYTKEQQLEIGRRIYISEITKGEAATIYDIGLSTARDYMRLYRDANNLPPKQSSYNKKVVEASPKKLTGYDLYSKEKFLSEVYMSENRYNRLIDVLNRKKNIILQGAPGVGKTYAAKRLAYSIMGAKAEDHIAFVQFHQNYTYEDFVMGFKPNETGFELKTGVFYEFCKKARDHEDEDYFFIIDEINRGNMSKIFGELLMLIENDYRGSEAILAYNGEAFSVPKNLYIIGMMNTADRSLALIDYALRRRFSFFDVEPGFDSEGFIDYCDSLENDKFNKLIECIKQLNKEIESDKSLGKGFCIGHSYFCNQEECTEDWLFSVIEYDILPTLSEYWFDDPGKINRWDSILHEALK